MKKRTTFSKILSEIRNDRKRIILALFLSLISVAASLLIPILVGKALDGMIGRGAVDFSLLFRVLLAVGACIALSFLSQFFASICYNRISFGAVYRLRERAFRKIQRLPFSYLDTHAPGDTISRIIADVELFSDGLLLGFSQLFTGILTILGTLVFMLVYNWKIALIVVFLTPASFLLTKFIAGRTYSTFRTLSEVRSDETAFTEEIISHQKTVIAFSAQEESRKKFDVLNDRLEKVSLKAVFFSSMVNPSTRLVNAIVYACVCLAGAFSVLKDPAAFSVGALSALLNYAGQYAKPFNEISGVITEFQNALACADRVFQFLEEKEESSDANLPAMEGAEGEVKFENVSFSYQPEKKLMESLNLTARPGQRIAIVGPTGCGKTTLINLLLRFYEAQGGAILVDGKPITGFTRASLRKNFGMVLQETWLKCGTVRENLLMGNPTASEEEMIRAAKATFAHEFIRRLPNGYDTVIGEDGGSLSEGQKQLLCITRVMLLSPPMLILDEATSNIDVRTEMRVQAAFLELMKGRTSFVVAHRLSTVKGSDLILVMKNGRIVESGTHEDLLSKNGFYAEIYNSQFI